MCYTLATPLFSGKEGAGTESASQQPWPSAQWLGFYGVWWQHGLCACCILYILAWHALHFFEVMTYYPIHPQPGYYSWAEPTGETATPPAESSLDERGGSIACLPWEKLREKGPHSNILRGACPALMPDPPSGMFSLLLAVLFFLCIIFSICHFVTALLRCSLYAIKQRFKLYTSVTF